MTSIGQVVKTFQEEYYVEEQNIGGIKVCLAVVLCTLLDGDPVWLFLVDASGGLKTVICKVLRGYPAVVTVDTLTPHSLATGKRSREADLLTILHRRVLVIKDFTTILAKRKDDLVEIMGQLRSAYDGYYEPVYGTVGIKTHEALFQVIAAVTPQIDRYYQVTGELGTRLLKCRTYTADREAMASKAEDNMSRIRPEGEEDPCKGIVHQYLDEMMGKMQERGGIPMTLHYYKDRLIKVADFVTRARAPVPRDPFTKAIEDRPIPEYPTRLVIQLTKIGNVLAFMHDRKGMADEDFVLTCKVAMDCIPYARYSILQHLWRMKGPCILANIARSSKLPEITVRRALEDMEALDLVAIDKGGREFKYKIMDVARLALGIYDQYQGRAWVDMAEDYQRWRREQKKRW